MNTFKKPEPMIKLYVLYSDELGIFLGPATDHEDGLAWSKRNPSLYSSAPTHRGHIDLFPGQRLVEVWPDLPGDRASIDACANAGLPRWNPDSK